LYYGKEEGEEKLINIKEIIEQGEIKEIQDINSNKLKSILNFWAIKKWVKKKNSDNKNLIYLHFMASLKTLQEKIELRHILAKNIVEYLFSKIASSEDDKDAEKIEVLVEFSVHELKNNFEFTGGLFDNKVSIEDIEDALFYLSRIEAIKIEGGFLVLYNSLTINRIEQNNKKQYTKEDYEKLNQFYENKVQQIHLVGEYARKMIEDY